MPPAQWLMEISVWFAGYLIKDLMPQHAPTLSWPAYTKEIALLNPFVHPASIRAVFGKCWYLPLFTHVQYLFVNVLADNKVAVITRWPLCPLAAVCQCVCVCVCLGVCVECPEWCITTPILPALGVCIDHTLEWRNACPAHKINGCCFLPSIGLLLSARNTKHIL